MALKPNAEAEGDALLGRFESYLLAERNVSENTRLGYMGDLAQLAGHVWGPGARPPFDWGAVGEGAARAFLAALAVAASAALPAFADTLYVTPSGAGNLDDTNPQRFYRLKVQE